MIPKFVKVVNNSVLYDGKGTFNFYVPEKHFDLRASKYAGEYIELLGVIDYAIEESPGKLSKLKRFYIPTRFMCSPTEVEKLKNVKLTKDTDPQDYRVLKFAKGAPIIVSIEVPQDIENVEALINMFIITGNIHNTIPYDELPIYAIENMAVNGNSYNLNLQMWGLIFSEICRDPKDTTKAFRLAGSTNMNAYRSISVKAISQMDSPFSAISSENFDDSIVRATLSTNQSESPLEKILTNDFDED